MCHDPNVTLKEEFEYCDGLRTTQLDRARECARLTEPTLLPPEGHTEHDQLDLPASSVGSQGVMHLSSKMLSALIPLNDQPFFVLSPKDGSIPDPEVASYLERLSWQVHRRLSSGNLRDTAYQMLQHLIVTGNCLLLMNDDMDFSLIRLDRYVVKRDPDGKVNKVVYITYEQADHDEAQMQDALYGGPSDDMTSMYDKKGYLTVYNCIHWCKECQAWKYLREVKEEMEEEGKFDVPPFAVLRWESIAGEHYGRAKCEGIAGDLVSLENFTQSLIDGLAASSRFMIGVSKTSNTDIEDLADAGNGDYVGAEPDDVFVISPANTMKSNIQVTQQAVDTMRREVSQAFLMTGGAIRQAERVTAAEVRALGQELEQVLGGAFSAIAREFMTPIIRRTVFLMAVNNEIDERIAEEILDDGALSASITTGLQALSRDNDLNKLMQLAEQMRNLPPEIQKQFDYNYFAQSMVNAMGFDSRQWIRDPADIQAEEAMKQQQQMQQQAAGQMASGAVGLAQQAAGQAIEQGASVEDLMAGAQDVMNAVQ